MSKTIAVIGAGGKTGRIFVDSALAAGYTVRAGYHHLTAGRSHPNLVAIRCDATSRDDMRTLLNGADVVVSLIGHTRHSHAADVQTKSIETMIAIMKQLGIQRIISLTGTGVRFPNDKPSLLDRILNVSIALIDPRRIQDGKKHIRVLAGSNLSWTVLRVLKLTNAKSHGRVKLSLTGPAELLTPRQRVADAVLQIIDDTSYIHEAPIVCGTE